MTKKHYFLLRNIDPVEIDNKYSFFISGSETPFLFSPNAKEETEIVKSSSKTEMRTKIADLSQKSKEQQSFSFLDESKKEHLCVLTMVGHMDHCVLPEKTTLCCFWDRHPFEFRPIGCPIQFIPDRIVKNYYSEITKDNYTLRENISEVQMKQNQEYYHKNHMELQKRNFYVTDGIFCSFNCCLAFIQENYQNPLYTYSENLLNNMYVQCFGDRAQPVIPASSWRLLKAYGGNLSIEDYRKSFYKIDYKDIDNIVFPQIRCKTMGVLFEKQIRI